MVSPGHSGHTATTTLYDFGIKDLLGNSFEDDEAFWAEFSKYEAESCTDLTKIPLVFPSPPTETLSELASAS